MANNRFKIYCTKDLECHTIIKYYPGSWFSSSAINTLDDFLEKHNACHEATFDGCGQFAFRTEEDDDGFIDHGLENRLSRKV